MLLTLSISVRPLSTAEGSSSLEELLTDQPFKKGNVKDILGKMWPVVGEVAVKYDFGEVVIPLLGLLIFVHPVSY